MAGWLNCYDVTAAPKRRRPSTLCPGQARDSGPAGSDRGECEVCKLLSESPDVLAGAHGDLGCISASLNLMPGLRLVQAHIHPLHNGRTSHNPWLLKVLIRRHLVMTMTIWHTAIAIVWRIILIWKALPEHSGSIIKTAHLLEELWPFPAAVRRQVRRPVIKSAILHVCSRSTST